MRSLDLTRSLVLVACASVLAMTGSACSSSEESAPPPPASPTTDIAPTVPALADEIAVDEIAVYQAVKTVVVKDGDIAAKRNAPVIAGRPAFVRVFVKATGRTRPTVEGELRVKRVGKADLLLRDGGKRVAPELDNELLEQTLNFEIPAEDMTADASLSLKFGPKLDAPEVLAFPKDGSTMPLDVKTASQTLRVKFVPVTYEADPAASITPDLADLATLKDTLYKMYPVANVEITVREPFKWSTPIAPDGPGWNTLLSGIMQLRRADKADRDVYYVGVLTPKPTIDQFCDKGSCILGIAPQADERDVGMRAALVLGYKGRGAGGTLAQELAHAMGRMHAPCGNPQAIDDDFPYGSGSIGVWGYDLLKKELIDPGNRYRDFMSYCGPVWISDYTFNGIYERMAILTAQQKAIDAQAATGAPGTPQTMTRRSLLVAKDGAVTEGPDLEVLLGDSRDTRDSIDITFEGARGTAFATAKGHVRSISGTGGRLVVLPEAPLGATRARMAGIGTGQLSQRLSPR